MHAHMTDVSRSMKHLRCLDNSHCRLDTEDVLSAGAPLDHRDDRARTALAEIARDTRRKAGLSVGPLASMDLPFTAPFTLVR